VLRGTEASVEVYAVTTCLIANLALGGIPVSVPDPDKVPVRESNAIFSPHLGLQIPLPLPPIVQSPTRLDVRARRQGEDKTEDKT
jgi:hypothetical protein